jgi:hypothetical protein
MQGTRCKVQGTWYKEQGGNYYERLEEVRKMNIKNNTWNKH